MKRTLSLILALVLCLSLAACGGVKLTVAEVEAALSDCDGTLITETSGDKVTSFTYTVEDVNVDDLVDKAYTREAMDALKTGDLSKITMGQVMVCKAILPLISIEALLADEDTEFNEETLLEKLLGIACEGKIVEYSGWDVSAKIDQANDSLLIKVVAK